MAPRSPRQGGFTYLGLIILVTVIGLVGAATIKVDALLQRAAAEEELLEAGAAFSAALESYAAVTPKGQPPYPPSLQELLKDPRTPGLRRHLRKIFVDPLTGSTEWGVLYVADNLGVMAVHSLSQAKPLKIGNFDARFVGFENKARVSEWKFGAASVAPVVPLAASMVPPLVPPLVPPQQPAALVAAPVAEQPLQEVIPPPPPPPEEPEEPPEEKPEEGKKTDS